MQEQELQEISKVVSLSNADKKVRIMRWKEEELQDMKEKLPIG